MPENTLSVCRCIEEAAGAFPSGVWLGDDRSKAQIVIVTSMSRMNIRAGSVDCPRAFATWIRLTILGSDPSALD